MALYSDSSATIINTLFYMVQDYIDDHGCFPRYVIMGQRQLEQLFKATKAHLVTSEGKHFKSVIGLTILEVTDTSLRMFHSEEQMTNSAKSAFDRCSRWKDKTDGSYEMGLDASGYYALIEALEYLEKL